MNQLPYCNIAAYKFITIPECELTTMCQRLKKVAKEHELKGTILVSLEGINLFLAGSNSSITNFQEHIASYPYFVGLEYKYSYSNFVPYQKLIVKIKNEIVTFKQDKIHPEHHTAPYISPLELKASIENNDDIILLDTRNSFEYEIGTFQSAIHLDITNFRDFPEALSKKDELDKEKPVITFCTGGIRCEKAAAYLLEQGFKTVYQLQGGILNYFAECGGEFYNGNCFVFDDRIQLNCKLEPVNHNVNENNSNQK